MKKWILLTAVTLFSLTTYAQHPAPPPEGDVAPAPLPMEGKKRLDPPAPRGRVKPTSRKALPQPPVNPPTPKTMEPDPVQ